MRGQKKPPIAAPPPRLLEPPSPWWDAAPYIVAWAIIIATVVGVACTGPASKPPEGPGTDFACGIWGVPCPGGTCCPWGHICGGHRGYFTTCPDGYCCFEGDRWPGGSAGDAGAAPAPRVVPARRPPR